MDGRQSQQRRAASKQQTPASLQQLSESVQREVFMADAAAAATATAAEAVGRRSRQGEENEGEQEWEHVHRSGMGDTAAGAGRPAGPPTEDYMSSDDGGASREEAAAGGGGDGAGGCGEGEASGGEEEEQGKEGGGVGCSELAECKRRGTAFYDFGQLEKAIEAYTEGVKLIAAGSAVGASPRLRASLYIGRAQAFCSMSKAYRSRPATRSEYSALYGLDPTHLAQLALADAGKALDAQPTRVEGHLYKGMSLFLLEKYEEAGDAYLAGLGIEPSSQALQAGLKEVQEELGDSKSVLKRQRTTDSLTLMDDLFECTLCMKLLFEPVTTPCGHTFCRVCFIRAMDHNSKCPMCRTVLHCGRALPVTVTLATAISRTFPDAYEERRAEERDANAGAAGPSAGTAAGSGGGGGGEGPSDETTTLPLFVMSVILPGEKMSLNVFEPRYRLMVRRAMEGNRRFGMAQVGPSRGLEEVLTEVEIVECNPLPDGRYHLDIVGKRRVQLLSSSELDGYRVATVRPFCDDPDVQEEGEEPLPAVAVSLAREADALLHQLRTLASVNPVAALRVRQLLMHVGERPSDAALQGPQWQREAETLGFWTAALLLMVSPSVHDHHRMHLLHMASSRQRLTWLKDHFAGAIPPAGRCAIM